MKKIPVTIVGGGATGLAVFVQLIDRMIEKKENRFSLTFIEKNPELSTGIVYSTFYSVAICNQRTTKMSFYPHDPNHFADWIKNNENTWKEKYPDFDPTNDFFPPRSLYGLYLQDIFKKTCKKAKENSIEFEIIQGEVVNTERNKKLFRSDWKLTLNNGRVVFAQKIVVFALGNFPPTTYKEFKSLKNYFASPWPDSHLVSKIPKDEEVLILGTRLTAIDVAITLISNGHRGKIFMVSRGGLLPKVKQHYHPHLTCKEGLVKGFQEMTAGGKKISLKQATDLIDEQMLVLGGQKIDWGQTSFPKEPAVESLKRDIAKAKENKIIWQSMVSEMGGIAEDFWNALTEESRKEFFDKYGKIWFVFLAMPIRNAERILSYLESGKLEISGGMKSVQYDEVNSNFVAVGDDFKIETPYLVNATDVGIDIREIESELLKNTLRSGLISPHPYGGVNVDFKTLKIIDAKGKVSKDIYCIGYLTRGVHFYTNDTSRLSAHAKRIVDDLLENC